VQQYNNNYIMQRCQVDWHHYTRTKINLTPVN
jgi:hypothetical protein